MDLKDELEKLKQFFGSDTKKFKEQYKLLTGHFTAEAERQQIAGFIESLVSTTMKNNETDMQNIRLRIKLIENRDILPIAYIARNYFRKSKEWLYQKINGNVVNGKPAAFSDAEMQTLNKAIHDISEKLGSIAIS
jgi:FtsP/CotA-like multicopper oxidase with cupredoxin domain